jgi:vitamin B12 transporter
MKPYLRLVASAAIVALLFPSTSVSEDAETEPTNVTPALVITANRYPTALEQVGSSISVIDEEEIEKRKTTTVLETLRSVPGLEVVQNGGPGRAASVFIRGADSDHTLVLIDGIRANDNTSGQFNFANLKAENIERIEVIRGAQSVLYGSEAIGGVINIITKTADKGVAATGSAEGGSYGTQQYRSSFSWGSDTFHTSTTASYFQTDGISSAASNRGNPEHDSYDNFSISNRSGVKFLNDGKADLTIGYSNSTTELDGFEFGAGAVDDPNAEQSDDNIFASLLVSKSLTESITPSIELGFTDIDTKGTDPDTEFNNFVIDGQTQSVTSKVDILLPWDGVLSIGHSYENRQGENKGVFDENRDVNSIFVHNQFSMDDKLFLTGGVRYDHDSDFGEEVTFRATAAYILRGSGSRLHASYGTGFKAPSFNELFFPNFGNPDLEAETSRSYDIGIEQTLIEDKATFDVTFFHNEIDNLITFDSTTFLAANIQESKALGIESTLDLELLSWLDGQVSYTYTDSENKTTGGVLPRRPRHRGTMQLFASPLEGLESSATLILVNSRRESDGSKMDNYAVVNTAVSYAVNDHLEPFIRVDNVFDEDYEEINGYGTPGFSVYAGIKGSL